MSQQVSVRTPPLRRGIRVGLRVAAGVLLAGVLLQPLSAGSFLGGVGTWGRTAHEIGANATFAVALLEGLLVLAVPRLRGDRRLLGGLVGVGVLLTGIIGLGYVGGGALALHVPLGVLVAVGASHHLQTVLRVTRDAEA